MPAPRPEHHRILLIDSYDSFSYNLADLVRRAIIGAQIDFIRNDELTLDELKQRLPWYSAIIVGPGPGSPCNDQDIGVIKHLWRLPQELSIPVFGVCLGFQSLAVEFGGILRRLEVVKHGHVSRLVHIGRNLFGGVGEVDVVRYHSLHVILPTSSESELERLAWTLDKDDNGAVAMAVAHKTRPFWAVQYHPESVCSTHGLEIISKFWDYARRWPRAHRDVGLPKSCHLNQWPLPDKYHRPLKTPLKAPRQVLVREIEAFDLPAAYVFEQLNDPVNDLSCALLDSAATPGRFSIVACSLASSQHITYRVGDRHILLRSGSHSNKVPLKDASVWEWLCSFMDANRASNGLQHLPFWGGLVGFISYAVGSDMLLAQSMRYQTKDSHALESPDLSFVFVERSIVLDSQTGLAYVQSLLPDDHEWVDTTSEAIQSFKAVPSSESNPIPALAIEIPDKARYLSQINCAKGFLASGDSYELCLTARTRVHLEGRTAPQASRKRAWELYNCLRSRNGAPFSCFLRLGPTTLLGSSPERFLSFSRQGLCQLRPIKGTASKKLFPNRKDAEAALSVQKEFAENLMIVDLIRHDLYGITGADVHVPKLCVVEEYETVWQLVSVIEGQGTQGSCPRVLGASLPPGSMTGAPKKRSVEILADLEDDRRGLYSGVCGYMDVGGGGDFSVIIRSCVHQSLPATGDDSPEIWEVGAGGAITALSDPESEWEEMLLKLRSVLATFQGPFNGSQARN